MTVRESYHDGNGDSTAVRETKNDNKGNSR
jgi:hypothetical protein